MFILAENVELSHGRFLKLEVLEDVWSVCAGLDDGGVGGDTGPVLRPGGLLVCTGLCLTSVVPDVARVVAGDAIRYVTSSPDSLTNSFFTLLGLLSGADTKEI